jgi:1,4-alpha-glucan branching enzyme
MPAPAPALDRRERARLLAGAHATPHDLLGAHPARVGGEGGVVVRAWHPDATGVDVLWSDGQADPLAGEGGLYGGFFAGRRLPLRYRLRFLFADGNTWERDDP